MMKFDIWDFVENMLINLKFHWNPIKITGTLQEDAFTFITISRWFLFRMRSVSNKSCRENQNTHFMFSYLFPKIVPFMRYCRKIWGSQRAHKWRHNMARMRFMLDKESYTHAHALPRIRASIRTHASARAHTHAHRQTYTIYCFPRQQLLRERASVLR